MKWLRYRLTFASGRQDWNYRPLYITRMSKEEHVEIRSEMDERAREYYWSDKFRGVEWEIINTKQVPNRHIDDAYENLKASITRCKNLIKEAKQNIITIGLIRNKGRKTCPDELRHKKRKKMLDEIKRNQECHKKKK